MRTLEIPNLSLVVLIGASGSGKSTFARRHFRHTEILSSDFFRGLVADDENDQSSSGDAFDSLYYVLSKRLARGRLTVVDATNVRPDDRTRLIEHARKFHCLPTAIVLNVSERTCHDRNRARADRQFGPHVIHRQSSDMKRGLRGLEREGFRHVYILGEDELAAGEIEIRRVPLWNDKRDQPGPFDIIGDLHGCATELEALLKQLGWQPHTLGEIDPLWGSASWRHPAGRRAIFVGDLVDRGPRVLDTVRTVRNMIHDGAAFCVAGNHDVKLVRWLRGKKVQVKHGLEQSIAEVESLVPEQRVQLAAFLDGLVSHYVLDAGRLVVAHAGLREEMHGRGSGAVREFCLYGETTGETDEFGLPIRFNWASEYRGKATVVYGHTPVPSPEWLNNTVNIDTGAVFGGRLTALRYPEREFAAVDAAHQYAAPIRPIAPPPNPPRSPQHENDDVLDIQDVLGKRIIETSLQRNITIREGNAIAALEIMSRHATDPHWLIYLPPTMSPSETSSRDGYLEYPTEALSYFRKNGVARVVCEEKHMGSRAVVVVCRDAQAAQRRFGSTDGRSGSTDGRRGACYTRTGRPFFPEATTEAEFIDRVANALQNAGFFEEFATDWFCLDCELMPWSAKARELIKQQYAAVGAAAESSLAATLQAIEYSPAAASLRDSYAERLHRVLGYRKAYRHYCWPVASLDDYRLAPFHLLASEGKVHSNQSNRWHMETVHRLAAADPKFILATPYREVDLSNDEDWRAAEQWWEQLTSSGGEGMVVKPLDFVPRGSKGLLQPALKCRGREYLRIIYGPEYTAPDQLPRLKARALTGKRSLAIREFALGIESLQRFIAREPLRRVHECVFGVLALESEPVDPRL